MDLPLKDPSSVDVDLHDLFSGEFPTVDVELDTPVPPPLAQGPQRASVPSDGPLLAGTLAGRILVVDDEEVVRDVVARILTREPDLAVTVCEDAESALRLLRAHRFDVLVTDKNLPGLGGTELIAEARRLQPSLEALMITGYASAESVVAAYAAGASDYLLKPFEDLRLVRAKVRAALERRAGRVQGRQRARSVAQQAAQLLKAGRQAPPEAREALELQLNAYEDLIRAGATGSVAVVGSVQAARLLSGAGLDAHLMTAHDPRLATADVVVLYTGEPRWQELATRLRALGAPDLLLLAAPEADLAELLEAISLRLDLVGFGTGSAGSLPDRVRTVLMGRAVERAQALLAGALTRFHARLHGPLPRR
jgi:DNA-binding response OmpR family regulator